MQEEDTSIQCNIAFVFNRVAPLYYAAMYVGKHMKQDFSISIKIKIIQWFASPIMH